MGATVSSETAPTVVSAGVALLSFTTSLTMLYLFQKSESNPVAFSVICIVADTVEQL